MAQYPTPSPTNMGSNNTQGFNAKTAAKASIKAGTVKGGVHDAKHLLNSHAPGKLGHNRSTSLRPNKK